MTALDNLREMKIGDTVRGPNRISVHRVYGGWIYYNVPNHDYNFMTETFVPWPGAPELQPRSYRKINQRD